MNEPCVKKLKSADGVTEKEKNEVHVADRECLQFTIVPDCAPGLKLPGLHACGISNKISSS